MRYLSLVQIDIENQRYRRVLNKNRLKKEVDETVTNCHALKMRFTEAHDKTFPREVLESMYKRRHDEVPLRVARWTGHCYGEHKRTDVSFVSWLMTLVGRLENELFGNGNESACQCSNLEVS